LTDALAARVPAVYRREAVGARLFAAAIAAACLAVLLAAATIQPNASGHGSHTQLGLPACGWATVTGKPCPTCGMTTAFAHAAHGRFDRAFITQPLGALLALPAAGTFWVAGHTAVTGSRLGRWCATMLRPRTLWVLGGLLVVSWIYKILTWT